MGTEGLKGSESLASFALSASSAMERGRAGATSELGDEECERLREEEE